MLEDWFVAAPTLTRLRSGPTGPFVEGFAQFLRGAGYVRGSVCRYLRAAAHLGTWMHAHSAVTAMLDERTLEAFTAHLPGCACLRRNRGIYRDARAGVRLFLAHLRDRGIAPPAQGSNALPDVVEQFEHWMRSHRGVTASTLGIYRPILVELVHKAADPARYTACALRSFLIDRAGRHGRGRAKTVVTAVRMFLRYLVAQGLCDAPLVDAIPTFAGWRLSSLPAYLSSEDVARLVSAPDATTPLGLRDRAILLLLARLGLRAGDVAGMRLGDIDWRAGMLHVFGKGRRACRLPLPQEVGNAILGYLTSGRPKTNDDHIFLRARAPHRRLRYSASVSEIVNRAAARARVALPRGGAHVLRHSVATGLLRSGTPLPVVRVLLRHRSEEATTLYAKVDVVALRKISRPWPIEVSSC